MVAVLVTADVPVWARASLERGWTEREGHVGQALPLSLRPARWLNQGFLPMLGTLGLESMTDGDKGKAWLEAKARANELHQEGNPSDAGA